MKTLSLNPTFWGIVTAFAFSACSSTLQWKIQDQALTENWQMQSSDKVNAKGAEISVQTYPADSWFKATVPGSILGAMVADSIYKNLFFNRNLEKIPDSLFNSPWWYRTTFILNKIPDGQTTRLKFNGINYRADIWLNGHKIASADTIKGGFCQFNLNVSNWVKAGKNTLAVKVTQPKAGEPTLGFVDWNPAPPDHNMGIWRNVRLQITGPVSINHPFVSSKVDTATLKHADLSISTLVQNHSDKTVKGILNGNIGTEIKFSKEIVLLPYETKKISFNPEEYAQLSIENPRLWWTHTLGKPNLYQLQLKFSADKQVSDKKDVRFGIRSVSDYFTADGHRGYKLNGKKILIKGGGWTDPMLLNATPDYERAGIDYAVHMNLNTLRLEGFWGNNQHLYKLCDEKGILIMVGWSAQWEWGNYFGTPNDEFGGVKTEAQMDVAARSWKDQVIWLRNHPSIMLWMYGSDKLPRPALEKRYLDILKKYDPSRPYVAAAQEHTSELTGPSAMKMRGPYDYVPPVYWYIDSLNGGAFGFNTETGPGPQIPVLESLKKMIPADSLWPINDAWRYHAARGEFHNFTAYNTAMNHRLGKPTDLNDYLRKAQYLNYEGMRAMFEAFESNRPQATGIIQWMYNSSWPKLWWQLYDYYLMPNGAFYGARKANEPIHISYNYANNSVEAMNNTLENEGEITARIQVLNTESKTVFQKTITVPSLKALSTQTLFQLPENLNVGKTWFLQLRLYNQEQQAISDNFYVLSTKKDRLDWDKTTWFITPQSQFADLTALQELPKVKLEVKKEIKQKGDSTFVELQLKNPTANLAFMVYLNFRKKDSNESLVPVFWDDNYISILPGEERTVTAWCETEKLQGDAPQIIVSGWNVD